MVAPWTFKDIKHGICEAEWLTQYVKKNYDESNGGLHKLKEYAVVEFKKKHPMERRVIDGKTETVKEAGDWYSLLSDVSLILISAWYTNTFAAYTKMDQQLL